MTMLLDKINIAMKEFAANTVAMSSAVCSSISSLASSMNALSDTKSMFSATVNNSNLRKVSDEQSEMLCAAGINLARGIINSTSPNIGKSTTTTPNVTTKTTTSNNSVSFTGDIIVNAVRDVDALSKDIVSQLPGAMLQTIYKK